MLRAKPWRPQPHRYSGLEELDRHAATLAGATAQELAAAVGQEAYNASPKAPGKTGVGHLVEWYFGKPPNPSDEPDIPELGIEIKSIPLEVRGRGKKDLGPKEPTSLTMIDFRKLAAEDWPASSVHRKLAHILWVPYIHDFDDKRAHRFLAPFRWRPDPEDLPQMERDYGIVREVVLAGRAETLSETLSVVLAARRKGVSDGTRKQPFSAVPAPSRAWALKTSYTSTLLRRQMGQSFLSIVQAPPVPRPVAAALRLQDVRTLQDAERFVVESFRRFEGRTTAEIARSLGSRMEESKNRHSAIVRRIIGLKRTGSVLELEKLGVRLHVLDVRTKDLRLHEDVPFPAMVLRTFAEEAWEESQLREHIDNILFVPTFSEDGALGSPHRLGRAFIWRPRPEDWRAIEEEWRMFQDCVKACRLEVMPPASATKVIHVRPHGRRAVDVDVDPCGRLHTKRCFWVNGHFVTRVLEARRKAGTLGDTDP